MADWKDLVQVTVLLDAAGIQRSGFTTLLIVGATTAGFATNEVKTYTEKPTTAQAAELGATLTAMVNAAFDQTPTPSQVKVGDVAAQDAANMDAILANDSDWFGLASETRVRSEILALAAWIEDKFRLYVAQSPDTGIKDTPYVEGAGSDVANDLKDLGRRNTALVYQATAAEYADVAWAAKKLAADPDIQTTTWAHATLAGVTSQASLTSTEKANIVSKNTNVYLPFFGGSAVIANAVTMEGPSGRFIDLVITANWIRARVQEAIAQLFLDRSNANSKVPYTDEGLAELSNAVYGPLKQGEAVGHFRVDSSLVLMPLVADIPTADIEAREVNFDFRAVPAGAVHKAIVTGRVTLDATALA